MSVALFQAGLNRSFAKFLTNLCQRVFRSACRVFSPAKQFKPFEQQALAIRHLCHAVDSADESTGEVVYDAAGNLVETHEQKGDFQEW